MAEKDKAYEQHRKLLSMDRPKGFDVHEQTTAAYVARWCAENGLKNDAETERLKKEARKKRIAGPKRRLP